MPGEGGSSILGIVITCWDSGRVYTVDKDGRSLFFTSCSFQNMVFMFEWRFQGLLLLLLLLLRN